MGGVCFLKTNRDRKDGGAQIDFFDGDGLVGGVCFLKTNRDGKDGGIQILFPAGRVGAY